MFSLSPNPPTSSHSQTISSVPTGFCGTPDIANAPRHGGLLDTGDLISSSRASFIDSMGALNPVSLMWIQPGQRPVQPDITGGMRHAEQGIASLQLAMDTLPSVRGQLRSALEAAVREARSGHQTLTLERAGTPDVARASNAFNAAVNFLDIADNLLALERGRFAPTTTA